MTHQCKYCLKNFTREIYLKKHECEPMRRHQMLKTNRGISAYNSYAEWIKCKGYRAATHDSFIESKFFKPFMRFAKFSQKVALPGKDKFIEYMAELDVEPKDWCKPIIYEHYISEHENLFTPDEQAGLTVDTVFELSRIFECETGEVFQYIEPSSLIQIIQAKKMSPWVLLCSKKFGWFVKNEMTREQKVLMERYMDPDKWARKFRDNPELQSKMQTYARALEI